MYSTRNDDGPTAAAISAISSHGMSNNGHHPGLVDDRPSLPPPPGGEFLRYRISPWALSLHGCHGSGSLSRGGSRRFPHREDVVVVGGGIGID